MEAVIAGLGDATDAIPQTDAHLRDWLPVCVPPWICGHGCYQRWRRSRCEWWGFKWGRVSCGAPLCAEDALFDVARRAGIGGSAYRTYHRRAVGAEGALSGDEWL